MMHHCFSRVDFWLAALRQVSQKPLARLAKIDQLHHFCLVC